VLRVNYPVIDLDEHGAASHLRLLGDLLGRRNAVDPNRRV
jgi:hypothetical protein